MSAAAAGDQRCRSTPRNDATTPLVAEGGSPDAGVSDAGHGDATAAAGDAGTASAMFSQAPLSFGGVNCNASGMKTLTIANAGSAALTVSASTTGSAFAVSPTSLSVPAGGSGMLTITATVPGSATAGTSLVGSLNLFTNDPAHANVLHRRSPRRRPGRPSSCP